MYKPKPTATKFVPGRPGTPNHGEAAFDNTELRDYVFANPRASWLVEDANGNPLGIAHAETILGMYQS
jgi:hypothetical protein